MARYLASVSAAALTLMLSHVSLAQTYRDSGGTVVQGIVPVGGNQSGPLFTPSNPGSVTGTFSASFSSFQPTPSYSYQSVTTTSATYALPTGSVAVFYNTGSTAITVKLGSSSVTVVAGQGDVIQPDSWMAFTVGSAIYYAVVGNGGTSSVVASGGAGLPTGAGGGGSGSGSGTMTQGSPNTVANAWPFAPVVSGSAVSSTNPLPIQGVSGGTAVPVAGTFWQTTQPVSLASLPALSAGSSVIGAVTESGTWTTGRTWSLSSGSDSVLATISGTPTISGTVTANAGTNLNTSALAVESGGNLAAINGKLTTSASGLKVDGSAVTQPISGAVSISGTPSVSISGNPVLGAGSNAIGKADILGSSGTAVDSAAGTANTQAITVQGNANGIAVPVTGTFWQSTQPVSISTLPALSAGSNTIGAVMQSGAWSTGRTWSLSSGSDSVTATISGTPSISGAVTANAGTNLNTSTLALESGGNLAGINGKLTTSANGLKVDASGVTQPISGAVSISGTPSVSISGNPVLGAGSNTIGKADILGSSGTAVDSAAGTANSQALTIQGNASGIPVPVSGSLSATIGGFTPTPSYSVESVTTTSVAYALPTGTVVVFYNTGANAITVKLGSSAVSVMAGQADVIQAGSWQAFTVGSSTYYAVVGNGGTSSVVASGGSGLPTGGNGGIASQTGVLSNATQLSIGASNLPVVSFLYLFNGTNFDQWSDSVVPGAANVAITGCGAGVCAPTSPANGVTNSVDVTSSGTSVQIAAARTGAIGTGRVSITVFNPAGAPGVLYMGFGTSGTCPSAATLTGNGAGAGIPIAQGSSFSTSVSAQVCGAYASSSGYVPYEETF